MMAAESTTLGPAGSPTGGVQGGARPRVPQADGRQDGPHSGSGQWAADAVGVSYRQVDYWARTGLLGEAQMGVGSGRRRRFADEDLEVMAALAQLTALGATIDWIRPAAAVVRAERVAVGEWLTVTRAAAAARHGADARRVEAGWTVPLIPFSEGRPR